MMRFFSLFLTLPTLLSAFSFSALRNMDMQYSLEGAALYWQPCTDDFIFGFEYGGVPTTVYHVRPNHHWGLSLSASIHQPCSFLSLNWTYLDARTSQTVSVGSTAVNNRIPFISSQEGDFYDPAEGFHFAFQPDTPFKASFTTKYCSLNLRYGKKLGCLYGFIGLRYLNLSTQGKVFAMQVGGESILFRTTSDFDGAAPEMGLAVDQPILCGFNAHLELSFLTALGHSSSRLSFNSFTNTGAFFPDESLTIPNSQTCCFPGASLRIAANYSKCFSCFRLKGEIGYALDQYWRVRREWNLLQASPQISSQNLGFAGPYFQLKATY